MRHRNNNWEIAAIAGLAAVLIFGFVIVPRLIANPPETSGGVSVVSNADPLVAPDVVTEDMGSGVANDESGNSNELSCFPEVNQISWEQAFESVANILKDYGYEVVIPSPLDVSNSGFAKDFYISYDSQGAPVYDPVCNVYLRHNLEVPGEIDIREYIDSEEFKGMSEAEIREIIDADDLSGLGYTLNAEHPKFKVLEGESCTIYFHIELNALTGEAVRGWEARVRFGEELSRGEARYFEKPIWDSDGYYNRLYY